MVLLLLLLLWRRRRMLAQEEGVRLRPHRDGASLRAICPDVVPLPPTQPLGFRMYYEAQNNSGPSTVRSAVSSDGKAFVPEQVSS
jgi:hypothetical protein